MRRDATEVIDKLRLAHVPPKDDGRLRNFDILDKKQCLYPPIFHYGYLLRNNFVKAYADECDLNVFNYADFGAIPTMEDWCEEATSQMVVDHLRIRLDMEREQLGIAFALFADGIDDRILSFATNYEPARMPSLEKIEGVRVILGEMAPPMWYMGRVGFEWYCSQRVSLADDTVASCESLHHSA